MNELELVIKNYTPAIIEINIEEVDKFMEITKEKYSNIVVTEDGIKEAEKDRATLNKLEKGIAEVRKTIDKKAKEQIEPIINKLKIAEKETKELSNNLNEQIRAFEEKQWQEKLENINSLINLYFAENENIKAYLDFNSSWRTKKYTLNKIEEEISLQKKKLLEKKEFIEKELEKANADIEFKILFETVHNLMKLDYPEIINEIDKKKNEIKTTEEKLKKQAEEKVKMQEEEAKRQEEVTEIETIEKEEIATIPESNPQINNIEIVEKNVEKEETYILIKVSGLNKEATNDLLEVIKKHNINYIKEVR